MHTINAVFLLGETALNSLVSFGKYLDHHNFRDRNVSFESLISTCSRFVSAFSDSLGFESDISSCGRSFTSFSNGLFMLVWNYGKNSSNHISKFCATKRKKEKKKRVLFHVTEMFSFRCFEFRWPYPFLDLASSYSPLW